MGGFVDDEGHALALSRAVEGDEADVGVRVLSPALVQLPAHLRRAGAPEHGQLPQRPVPAVVVPRHPAVAPVDLPGLHITTIYMHATWSDRF